jgi:hypothetical protein
MKTPSTILLVTSGLAIGMLTSCVVPYDSSGGYGSATFTTSTYQPGYRLTSLPSGYRSEVIAGNNYYYHNGAYYRRDSNGYIVVDAPRTSRYYSDYDQRRGSNNYRTTDGYRDHRDQRNDSVRVITRLPSGYRVVNHGGTEYYQAGDQFYRRQADGYMVVSSPY